MDHFELISEYKPSGDQPEPVPADMIMLSLRTSAHTGVAIPQL